MVKKVGILAVMGVAVLLLGSFEVKAAVAGAPAITSPLTAAGAAGTSFIYTITATGNAPIVFTATAEPSASWLTFNATAATLTGTPPTGGEVPILLTASNSVGEDIETLVINIAPPAPAPAPVIVSEATATPEVALVNTPIAFSFTAKDSDGDFLSYSWNFGDGTTQSIGATATHSYSVAGPYTVKVTATNGVNNVSSQVLVLINAVAPTGTFTVSKASIKFDFGKQNSDSLTMSGEVVYPANIASGSQLNGTTLTFDFGDFGDYSVSFTTAIKGKTGKGTSSGNGSASIKLSYKNNIISYTLSVKKASLYSLLKDQGFGNTEVTKQPVNLIVSETWDGASGSATAALTYTVSKKATSGSASSGK